jgi:hypothetical protein
MWAPGLSELPRLGAPADVRPMIIAGSAIAMTSGGG